MTDTLIKVEGVSKKFCRSLKRSLWYGMQDLGNELLGRQHGNAGQLRKDEFWAVKDVSFEVRRGECLGLIGKNGAGKTTLLRMINGLIKPDSGRIKVQGRLGALIALGAGFNPVLSGRENIYINAAVLGFTKHEVSSKVDQIIEFSGIKEFIDMPVQSYSSGMTVRLGFSIAIHSEPETLLLDEVLAVGDMDFQARCFNALSSLRKKGTGFILVSHNMHHMERYASKTLLLNGGVTEHLGTTDEGLQKYLRSQDTSYKESESPDWRKVNGSGKLRFLGARFLAPDGTEVHEIRAGEGVTLEISVSVSEPFDGKAVIDLTIFGTDGLIFQTTSQKSGLGDVSWQTTQHIEIKFPTLPSTSRHLDFCIAALDPTTKEIMDWKRGIRLKIRTLQLQHGKLELPNTWEVK